ncbi:sensor histidine kinase [Virgibacillus kimchii]
MFNKISFKIGLLFFVFILIIESFLFFILYVSLVNDRIEEIMDDLLARGNTHRDVLELNFDRPTVEHVRIMESASDFIVVITDAVGNPIANSDPIEPEMREVIEHTDYHKVPQEGEVLVGQWRDRNYISTDSPISIDGQHEGHVFMFAHTDHIKRVVTHLSEQFLLVGLITVVLTIITIFILSRFITLPLIKIKEATEILSEGKGKVELYTGRKDELGELSYSITKLSRDLDRIKNDRNEFLASISHELRTPLTYIKGYADVINRPDITEDEKKEYIDIIREETESLTVLIKNLFELAKMDENNFAIHREKVLLRELIHSLSELIRPAYEEKNITFSFSFPKETVVYVDPHRFQQVLLNILDNARKHSFAGGQVKLKVNETNQETNIVITDNGEGMPKEELENIFERLYRVEKSRSRLSGGTGLGLTIAKEIVESHGGTIEIRSDLGKGTSVIISLRRVSQDE